MARLPPDAVPWSSEALIAHHGPPGPDWGRQRRHTVCMVIFLAGGFDGLWMGRPVRGEAGVLHIYWHSYRITYLGFDPRSETAVVHLPFAWFMRLELPGPLTGMLRSGELVRIDPEKPHAHADAALMRQACDWMRQRTSAMLEAGTQLCTARLRAEDDHLSRHAPEGISHALPGGSGRKAAHVEGMARFIAERFADDIRVEDVTDAAGVSAMHGMRLFKQATGTTIQTELVQHRLAEAMRLLISETDLGILDLAYRSGFGSRTQLYHAFRQHAGTSPAAYRRAMLRG